MRPLLILTKNLLIEQPMQEQLQYLNYEVFCSVRLMKQLKASLNPLQLIQSYQAIIFSETLSDEEIRQLLTQIGGIEDTVLIRKFGHLPAAEEKESLAKLGMNTWIYADQTADFLREHLAENLKGNPKKENPNVVFLYQKEGSSQSLNEFKAGLSKNECKVFECLLASEGGTISREEMCHHLWRNSPNNSRMSQLSVLMKRLKGKLYQAGFHEELIETV